MRSRTAGSTLDDDVMARDLVSVVVEGCARKGLRDSTLMGHGADGYRRSSPPRVPRTMARPMVLPIEPATCLPTSPATLPATRFTTDRVTSRATCWPTESLFPRGRFVPNISPIAFSIPLIQPPTPPDCSLPGGGGVVDPVCCTRWIRTS